MNRALVLVLIAGFWLVTDQLSKAWAVEALTQVRQTHPGSTLDHFAVEHPKPGPAVPFAGTWGYFEYVENPGAAWNILSGAHESFRYPFFFVVGIVMMTLMLGYYFRSKPEDRLRRLGLACVIGGALGNFVDRVRLRYVIDFIVVDLGSLYRWPTFNIADAAIAVGVICLLAESFLQRPRATA
jgi:signal peptidase II